MAQPVDVCMNKKSMLIHGSQGSSIECLAARCIFERGQIQKSTSTPSDQSLHTFLATRTYVASCQVNNKIVGYSVPWPIASIYMLQLLVLSQSLNIHCIYVTDI